MLVAVLVCFAHCMVQFKRRGQRRKRQQAQPQKGHHEDEGKPFHHTERKGYTARPRESQALDTQASIKIHRVFG